MKPSAAACSRQGCDKKEPGWQDKAMDVLFEEREHLGAPYASSWCCGALLLFP